MQRVRKNCFDGIQIDDEHFNHTFDVIRNIYDIWLADLSTTYSINKYTLSVRCSHKCVCDCVLCVGSRVFRRLYCVTHYWGGNDRLDRFSFQFSVLKLIFSTSHSLRSFLILPWYYLFSVYLTITPTTLNKEYITLCRLLFSATASATAQVLVRAPIKIKSISIHHIIFIVVYFSTFILPPIDLVPNFPSEQKLLVLEIDERYSISWHLQYMQNMIQWQS